jgi:hypothetical protein
VQRAGDVELLWTNNDCTNTTAATSTENRIE